MKRLPNKELTEEELSTMFSSRTKKYTGSEGFVILDPTKGIARKIFYSSLSFFNENLENKLEKLKILYQWENFDNDIKVLTTLSYNGEFFGYDMFTDRDYIELLKAKIPLDQREYYFQLIEEKLEYFHHHDMVYGDVKSDNILVNSKKKNIAFCDLDNIQIGSLPVDCCSDYLLRFSNEDDLFEEDADRYMYNLMVLSELDGLSRTYDEVLELLSFGCKFPYLKKSADPILRELEKAEYSFKGDYLTKHLELKRYAKKI